MPTAIGLRPIAVGMALRRLVAKVANRVGVQTCVHFLVPRQVGVGTKCGVEAAVHAARSYLASCPSGSAFIKPNFVNAFNCIRRDCVLEAAAFHIPELLPFLLSSYSNASILQFGDFEIQSQEGLQQGDPLVLLLFSLTVAEVLNGCEGDLAIGYLDDFTLGGIVETLIDQVKTIETQAYDLGLTLSHEKCEDGLAFSPCLGPTGRAPVCVSLRLILPQLSCWVLPFMRRVLRVPWRPSAQILHLQQKDWASCLVMRASSFFAHQ